MTYFLALHPIDSPSDLGSVDDDARCHYVFNMLAQKRPSATFEDEVVSVLVDAGVGLESVNIFATSKATIPPGEGPFLSVRSTPGAAPLGTHQGGAGAYLRPGLQIIVRAARAADAAAMSHAAFNALLGVRNREISA